MKAIDVKKDLELYANKKKAQILQGFFKTGKGEYGEGDVFIGITVPNQRSVAKTYQGIEFSEIKKLLDSKIHEDRLTGVLILTYKYNDKHSNKKEIYNFYMKNSKGINNWDLVDLSAPNIVGTYLLDKDRKVLYKLAKSKNLWQRRISILATFTFIKNNDFKDSLKIAEILLNDQHNLMHKAVGWMLREIGKKNQLTEEKFLKKHYKTMPRTMLRYAIERFEEGKRQKYLKGLA